MAITHDIEFENLKSMLGILDLLQFSIEVSCTGKNNIAQIWVELVDANTHQFFYPKIQELLVETVKSFERPASWACLVAQTEINEKNVAMYEYTFFVPINYIIDIFKETHGVNYWFVHGVDSQVMEDRLAYLEKQCN